MNEKQIIYCLIAFILGYLLSRQIDSMNVSQNIPTKVTSGKHRNVISFDQNRDDLGLSSCKKFDEQKVTSILIHYKYRQLGWQHGSNSPPSRN